MTTVAPPQEKLNPYATYGAIVAFILLVSSSPAVTRLAVTHTMTVYDLVALRCGIGALIMLPYFLMQLRYMSRKLLLIGFGLAVVQGWGVHLTTIAGLQFAPAAHASILGPGVVPVWVAMWAWLFYRKHPTRNESVGITLMTLGAAVLFVYSSGAFTWRTLVGELLFLAASCGGAFYLVYIQHERVPPMRGAAMVAVYSGVAFLPIYFAIPVKSRIPDAPLEELLLQIFYQGFGAGALFVVLLSFAVVRLGSQRFSIMVACVPILALLFGRWIAGDGISAMECLAVALVSSGVLYGAFYRRRLAPV